MKIIVGTPKSGSTFITKYIHNQYSDYTYLKEHFQPLWYPSGDIDAITKSRLESLHDRVVFKVHSGKETHEEVWNFVYKHSVILIERKDKLAQFVSLGLSYLSNVWTVYNNDYNPIPGTYKKQWFDDLCFRLDDLEKRKPKLDIESHVWYEDISDMEANGTLPVKQHKQPIDELLNMFTNKEEFLGWYNERY